MVVDRLTTVMHHTDHHVHTDAIARRSSVSLSVPLGKRKVWRKPSLWAAVQACSQFGAPLPIAEGASSSDCVGATSFSVSRARTAFASCCAGVCPQLTA